MVNLAVKNEKTRSVYRVKIATGDCSFSRKKVTVCIRGRQTRSKTWLLRKSLSVPDQVK